MSLKLLLTLSGGIEALGGALTLIAPALAIDVLLGRPADSIAIVLARFFGAGMFALGLACLKARDDIGSPAGLAVVYAITCYNVVAAILLLWAAVSVGLGGVLLWAAGIGHAVLGILLGQALLHMRRTGLVRLGHKDY
jgi:hypothetical protein